MKSKQRKCRACGTGFVPEGKRWAKLCPACAKAKKIGKKANKPVKREIPCGDLAASAERVLKTVYAWHAEREAVATIIAGIEEKIQTGKVDLARLKAKLREIYLSISGEALGLRREHRRIETPSEIPEEIPAEIEADEQDGEEVTP